jgi:hypothetical protein
MADKLRSLGRKRSCMVRTFRLALTALPPLHCRYAKSFQRHVDS